MIDSLIDPEALFWATQKKGVQVSNPAFGVPLPTGFDMAKLMLSNFLTPDATHCWGNAMISNAKVQTSLFTPIGKIFMAATEKGLSDLSFGPLSFPKIEKNSASRETRRIIQQVELWVLLMERIQFP